MRQQIGDKNLRILTGHDLQIQPPDDLCPDVFAQFSDAWVWPPQAVIQGHTVWTNTRLECTTVSRRHTGRSKGAVRQRCAFQRPSSLCRISTLATAPGSIAEATLRT